MGTGEVGGRKVGGWVWQEESLFLKFNVSKVVLMKCILFVYIKEKISGEKRLFYQNYFLNKTLNNIAIMKRFIKK